MRQLASTIRQPTRATAIPRVRETGFCQQQRRVAFAASVLITMASSFEKSVKGATKVKVRRRRSFSCHYHRRRTVFASGRSLTTTIPGRAPKDKVHRAYSDRNTCRRSWCWRGVQGAAVPTAGLYMDHRLQELDHSPPDDSRRLTRCDAGLSRQAQEHPRRERVL